MELLKKILAKEFLWFFIALLFAFPLAFIPMVVIEYIVTDYEAFITKINGQVVLLYFVFVATCFAGIILIRLASAAVKTLFEQNAS